MDEEKLGFYSDGMTKKNCERGLFLVACAFSAALGTPFRPGRVPQFRTRSRCRVRRRSWTRFSSVTAGGIALYIVKYYQL